MSSTAPARSAEEEVGRVPLQRLGSGAVHGLRGWGWLAPASLGLLVGAAAVHGGPSSRWQAEAEAGWRQAAANDRMQRVAAATQRSVDPVAKTDRLPQVGSLEGRFAALLEAAKVGRLRMGDVTVADLAGDFPDVRRRRVTMALQGRYVDVRSLMQTALAVDGALSLDQVRFIRTQADSPEIQAELVWSLYARTSGRAAP